MRALGCHGGFLGEEGELVNETEEEGRKIAYMWCDVICYSIPHIFYKLVVVSRGLIRFRFNFSGKISLLVMLGSFYCVTSWVT